MDLNSHPCSFLDAHLHCVSKSCDDKSCYDFLRLVFLSNMVPMYGIDDTIQRATCVYNLMSILSSAVFIKFKSQIITTAPYL